MCYLEGNDRKYIYTKKLENSKQNIQYMLTLHWWFQMNIKRDKREEGLKEIIEIYHLYACFYQHFSF